MAARASISGQDRSLLALVVDVTSWTWGERELKRNHNDKARKKAGKGSVGPATLPELVSSIIAFCSAFSCLNRENCVMIVAVAGDEVSVVYPRKGGELNMTNVIHDPPTSSKIDIRLIHDYLKLGVAELVARDSSKAEKACKENPTFIQGCAISAGLSVALCCINRFSCASLGGVSALMTEEMLRRQEDDSILALMTEGKAKKVAKERDEAQRRARGVLSPSIFIIQATKDRTCDYNAFMNCTFAASKARITIDGCFIPSGIQGEPKSSSFLVSQKLVIICVSASL